MEIEFWHQRWMKNQIGFHQQEINSHLQEFWQQLNLPDEAPVFVPLCGKSRDMLWLRARGHPVLGVEISPIAVRDFFAENDLVPDVIGDGAFERWESDGLTILCGDFFDLDSDSLAGIAGVYDRASLVALPVEMRPRYAHYLNAILPANTGGLLVTMEYRQDEMEGPPFSVQEEEVTRLFQEGYETPRLFSADILQENPQFGKKGLTGLMEKVYRLIPRVD